MLIFKAIGGGLSRSFCAPLLLLGLWLVNAAFALPPSMVVRASLQESFGTSLAHRNMRDGFDMGWYGEYRAKSGEVGATFSPEVTGAGPFYANLESWITGGLFEAAPWIIGLGAIYGLVWALLLGGVLDRWARHGRPDARGSFLAAGGRYFSRFLRLALLSAVLYFLIYKLHGWTFERLEQWTRDVTSERTVFLASAAGYALTAFLLTLVHNCFGYAKIATVLEDRRSVFFAALRGIGFVLTHPGRTLGLYYAVALLSVLLLATFSLLAPGPGQATAPAALWAFLVAQLFLGAKLVVRLSLLGAQMSMYQDLVDSASASSSVSLGR